MSGSVLVGCVSICSVFPTMWMWLWAGMCPGHELWSMHQWGNFACVPLGCQFFENVFDTSTTFEKNEPPKLDDGDTDLRLTILPTTRAKMLFKEFATTSDVIKWRKSTGQSTCAVCCQSNHFSALPGWGGPMKRRGTVQDLQMERNLAVKEWVKQHPWRKV